MSSFITTLTWYSRRGIIFLSASDCHSGCPESLIIASGVNFLQLFKWFCTFLQIFLVVLQILSYCSILPCLFRLWWHLSPVSQPLNTPLCPRVSSADSLSALSVGTRGDRWKASHSPLVLSTRPRTWYSLGDRLRHCRIQREIHNQPSCLYLSSWEYAYVCYWFNRQGLS